MLSMNHRYSIVLCIVLSITLLFVLQGFVCLYQSPTILPSSDSDTDTPLNYSLSHVLSLSDVDNILLRELPPILVPRVPGTASHAKVKQHILSQLRQLGDAWSVTSHEFTDMTPYGEKNFTNIIATLHPSVERRLALVAHYDSKLLSEGEFLGATDSALPCALLLDLAQSLNSLLTNSIGPSSFETLQLIFLDGEEAFKHWTPTDSIYGARKLSAAFQNGEFLSTGSGRTALESISCFLLLDLLGARNTAIYRYPQTTATATYSLMVRVESALKKKKVIPKSVTYFSSHTRHANIEDDHIPFLKKGVPVMHAISWPFPSVWHTLKDDSSALDRTTVKHLQKLFQVFVCKRFEIVSLK